MTDEKSTSVRVISTLIAALSVAIAISALLTWGSGTERADANAPLMPAGAIDPTPASVLEGASAMRRLDTGLVHVPELVGRLPQDMAAEPGSVRQLFSQGAFRFYAWPHGKGGACFVSTRGAAGCVDRFDRPFVVGISDFDRLGSGDPVIVSGLVHDDVDAVDVIVDGKAHAAVIQNNVAFFQLPDARMLPSAVEKVTVTLSDGSTRDIHT